MTVYYDLQKEAKGLLVEFNQTDIKLVRIDAGSGDEDEPGTPVETLYQLHGTVSGVTNKYLDSGFITSDDLIVTCTPLDGVIVGEGDFIDLDGQRHKILRDVSVPPFGTKIVWKFIVRKGG